ncbi:hypothetical protein [Profundicola chukchiensis]|uniref:hypothetical protein n=1 Tax=Profundicola chukchiensis TaxID=2961959 RepID=UPI0026F3A0B5|nr:hypothetical protein [Profundicola chukchiensis]
MTDLIAMYYESHTGVETMEDTIPSNLYDLIEIIVLEINNDIQRINKAKESSLSNKSITLETGEDKTLKALIGLIREIHLVIDRQINEYIK